MIYPIRLYGDPVLRKKAKEIKDLTANITVEGFEPVSVAEFAKNMLETMYQARGVGLAAPQVGVPLRMFVMAEYADEEETENPEERQDKRLTVVRELVIINPKLEFLSKKQDDTYQEGCLSIPGVYEEGVPRYVDARLTYQDVEGNTHTEEGHDFLARVWQHEFDHLNGKFFLDYLPAEVVNDYRKELAQFQRKSKAYLSELKNKKYSKKD